MTFKIHSYTFSFPVLFPMLCTQMLYRHKRVVIHPGFRLGSYMTCPNAWHSIGHMWFCVHRYSLTDRQGAQRGNHLLSNPICTPVCLVEAISHGESCLSTAAAQIPCFQPVTTFAQLHRRHKRRRALQLESSNVIKKNNVSDKPNAVDVSWDIFHASDAKHAHALHFRLK